MLEKVRNSMQSGATYVLVAGLTVIFMFFFGMPTQTCSGGAQQTRAHLATVAGQSVYTDDVNLIYNRIYGSERTDEEEQYRQRRAKSLRNILYIKLFAERARSEGLRVSDEEFKQYIMSATRNIEYRYQYGRNGSFNGHYYKAYVQNQLRTPLVDYEAFKRDELLARKYLASRASQIMPPSFETSRAHEIKNTKMNLSFVSFSPDKLRESIEVTDEQLETFLEENAERIDQYYADNKEEKYTEPAQIRLRRVLISKPMSTDGEAKAKEVAKKWKEAKTRVLEQDEPVADVAADLGEHYKESGIMDWSELNKDKLPEGIYPAVKEAEVGDIEEVETDTSYMLVKVEDRKKAKTTPLDEVREEIATHLIKKDQVDSTVQEVTDKLLAKAKEMKSISKALEALRKQSDKQIWKDLSVEETGDFTLESQGPSPQMAARFGGQLSGFGSSWTNINKIGDSQELAVDAYKKLTTDNPVADKIYEVDGTNYIVRLKSKKAPESDTPDDTVEYALSSQKVNQVLGRWSALFGSINGQLVPPMDDYGPWLNRQLKQAVDEGAIAINTKRSPVAARLSESLKPGSAPGATGGKAGKARQILEQLKAKQKQKKGGSGAAPPAEGSSDESGGEGGE
jgi:hypothetical protein